MKEPYKILIAGLGPVGAVTLVGLAELGHRVKGIDIDEERVKLYQKGEIPFYEPGLEDLFKKNLEEGKIFVDIPRPEHIEESDVIFICVGTPTEENGEVNLTYLKEVVKNIQQHSRGYTLVVQKSTVPVLTARWMEREFKKYKGKEIEVASNPEFLREGSALYDFFNPDRIVIGVRTKRAEEILREIYKGIDAPIIVTDIETSEIIKHASNSFLAVKISFINMISDLCEATGADVLDVAYAMGLDKRIGPQFLGAGVGFGGSCLPKDLKAFIHVGRKLNLNFDLLRAAWEINVQRIPRIISIVKKLLNQDLNEKKICIFGLSFKPNTDDIRDAPSINIVRGLLLEGAYLRLNDPHTIPNFKKMFPENPPSIQYFEDPYECARGADLILLVTEWDVYRNLDYQKIKNLMNTPIILDGRNFLPLQILKEIGFTYKGIGRRE